MMQTLRIRRFNLGLNLAFSLQGADVTSGIIHTGSVAAKLKRVKAGLFWVYRVCNRDELADLLSAIIMY